MGSGSGKCLYLCRRWGTNNGDTPMEKANHPGLCTWNPCLPGARFPRKYPCPELNRGCQCLRLTPLQPGRSSSCWKSKIRNFLKLVLESLSPCRSAKWEPQTIVSIDDVLSQNGGNHIAWKSCKVKHADDRVWTNERQGPDSCNSMFLRSQIRRDLLAGLLLGIAERITCIVVTSHLHEPWHRRNSAIWPGDKTIPWYQESRHGTS
jgi:hypothetical protein